VRSNLLFTLHYIYILCDVDSR